VRRGWHGHGPPWHRHGHRGPPHWAGRRPHGLHKQIFIGFGVAIGVAMLAAWMAFWLVGGGSTWKREMSGARAFVGERFGRVWSDPAARRELGESIARSLDVGLVLREQERTIDVIGDVGRCRRSTDVALDGGRAITICHDRHGPRWGVVSTVVVVAIPAFVLWVLAGLWARRLSRPLRELTQVARDLGDGKLERRARLRHGLRGEVGELTHAVNEMATRIEKQIKEQRELLAAVSHELRTPLARVRVLLEIGRDQEGRSPEAGDSPAPPPPRRDVLGEVETEIVDMDRLVGDLLANARLEFSALTPRPLDPIEIAERTLSRAGAGGAGGAGAGDPGRAVRLDAPAPSETAPIPADPTLLSRALGALLDNAAKHGGGARVLRVVDLGDRVGFEVEDDGPGFADEDLPRVFDPFYRGAGGAEPLPPRPGDADGAPPRAKPHGLGLGLAIVRRIAEAHGGRAYARNVTPRGACVGFELPRPRDGAPAPA
jgi:signal transduction histidine kinase